MTDGEETAMLDRILTTEGAAELRRFVRDRLDLRGDESVLSIGCGPGHEPASLAEAMDEGGRVPGADANPETLHEARERCGGLPQVSFVGGDATRLPVSDDLFDVAIAKQVYQFVPDVETALSELPRVLAPGGRAAVFSRDEGATVLNATDPELMRRAMAARVAAMPHPYLDSRLASLLPEAGFTDVRVVPRADVHTEIDAQVERGIEVHRRTLEEDGSFESDEIDAWERDLRELDAAGEVLSCGTGFLYLARR